MSGLVVVLQVSQQRVESARAIGISWFGCVSARWDIIFVLAQAPVAQLDRAPDFESGGQGFESLPARQQLVDFDSEFLRDFLPVDSRILRAAPGQHPKNFIVVALLILV